LDWRKLQSKSLRKGNWKLIISTCTPEPLCAAVQIPKKRELKGYNAWGEPRRRGCCSPNP